MSTAAQLAASARHAFAGFAERLALRADEISAALEHELHLVAWDREQLIGAMQARLWAMAAPGPGRAATPTTSVVGARVLELCAQPLEAIELTWACLLAGRRVAFGAEPGACSATASLIHALASTLPQGAIVDAANEPQWPILGVEPAIPRIAWVDATADRELAAYSLARTSLRRSGADPRGVRFAVVVGPTDLLRRHLVRLWVGAQLGPADDPDSFAGPVDGATRDAFVAAQAAWTADPRVEVWCAGGELEHAGASGSLLAPAAFAVDAPIPELPMAGPMCCIVRAGEAEGLEIIRAQDARGAAIVQIGGRPLTGLRELRHLRGAVLVERLPPGLPEPRPV